MTFLVLCTKSVFVVLRQDVFAQLIMFIVHLLKFHFKMFSVKKDKTNLKEMC